MKHSLAEWVQKLREHPIPVMANTIISLKKICGTDTLPVHEIVAVVEKDPGLAIHLIRTCSSHKRGSLSAEVTSVQQAVMMLGTKQLNELPKNLPNMEKTLGKDAQQHLLQAFTTAYHAAMQAFEWSKIRRDMVPDEVFVAAQMHFVSEMLFAIEAPEILDEIHRMVIEEHLPSEEAQYIVLGFTLDELAIAMAIEWTLPNLLVEALQAENALHPRAYTIMLAVQLARGASYNWYSEKIIRIENEAAEWLGLTRGELVNSAHKLAVEIARRSIEYKTTPAAAKLPLIPQISLAPQAAALEIKAEPSVTGVCLSPQIDILRNTVKALKALPAATRELAAVINTVVPGMHLGIGLNRVVFAKYEADFRRLTAISVKGSDNDPIFSRFVIDLKIPNLFTRIMEQTQAVWVHDENRARYWNSVPVSFQKHIQTNNFMAISLFKGTTPVGMFYADRHSDECQLDEQSYKYFKGLALQTADVIRRMPKLHL